MKKNGFLIMPSKVVILGFAILPLLSSCSQKFDLQGHNPQEYYDAHPIESKVETRHSLLVVRFDGSSSKFYGGDDSFVAGLNEINPHAVDAITLYVASGTPDKNNQVQHIKKILRKSGFSKPVKLVSDGNVPANEIIVDITYAAVILPDCPDWKKSPVTTYSNTPPANYGCASAYNLGLMIDDPHDLVRGRGSKISNSERSSKVLSDYRSGTDASTATGASGASASSSQ